MMLYHRTEHYYTRHLTMKVLCVLVIISAGVCSAAQSQSQYQDPAGAFPALQSNFSSQQEDVDQVGDLTIYR